MRFAQDPTSFIVGFRTDTADSKERQVPLSAGRHISRFQNCAHKHI